MTTGFGQEVVECPNCGAEYENSSYCAECGYGQEVGELVEAPLHEPVYARSVDAKPLPVHEPAWCPYCLAWLGNYASQEEARAAERGLAEHPIEFCVKHRAKLSSHEAFQRRRTAQRFGSLAATTPARPRSEDAGVSA